MGGVPTKGVLAFNGTPILLVLLGEPTPFITAVFESELDLRFVSNRAWCCLCKESLPLEIKDGVPPTATTEVTDDISFCDDPIAALAAAPPKWGPAEPVENSPDFDDNGELGKVPADNTLFLFWSCSSFLKSWLRLFHAT